MKNPTFFLWLLLPILFCLPACEKSSSDTTKDQVANFELPKEVSPRKADVKIQPGHIVMMVNDLDKSQQFYEEHLGFHTNEDLVYEGLRRIFMSASEKHHELVLLESRVAEFPHKDNRQLQQVAFELSSHEVLVEYYNHIKETDIPFVIKDNQVSLSLYFPDPDGVTVELYWDITKEPFGEDKWEGRQEDISDKAFLDPYSEMDK